MHARGKPIADDVRLDLVAKRAIGFSGASLANLMNEAALRALRRSDIVIRRHDILNALDRITVGLSLNSTQSFDVRERVAVQLGALGHHRRDEALVLAAELGERRGALLQVELADLLQDFPLLHGLILRAMFRDELLRQLVHVTYPIPEDVRVAVTAPVGVEIRDPTVSLLARNEVAMFTSHDNSYF